MYEIIDIAPIISGETDKFEFDIDFAIDSSELEIDAAFLSNVTGKGVVVNNGGRVKLKYDADILYSAHCDRCLTPVQNSMKLSYEAPIVKEGTLQNDDTDEYVIVKNQKLDLLDLIKEQIILEYPSKILCKEECKGLCSFCGANLNDGECNCDAD